MMLVSTTFASEEDALRAARIIVAERMASCAHISMVRSVYRWKGEVLEDQEARAEFKTGNGSLDKIVRKLREIHPYELPVIEWTEMEATDEAEAWNASETDDV